MGKKKREVDSPQLDMTPMIDVVFQLLIFFIVTLKQTDILSQLDVTRPAPQPPTNEKPPELLEVTVYNEKKLGGEGVSMQQTKISYATLESQLAKTARINSTVSVVIKCTMDSSHSNLIRVLDICSKVGLKNISVFSM